MLAKSSYEELVNRMKEKTLSALAAEN
jgi:hypothetical protein